MSSDWAACVRGRVERKNRFGSHRRERLPATRSYARLDCMGASALSFSGTLEELQKLVNDLGVNGTWSAPSEHQHQCKAKDGAVLNWFHSTGKLTFQGKSAASQELERQVTQALGQERASNAPPVVANFDNKKVFVVHGHDTVAREQLERILLILKLQPFVLQDNSSNGMTLIEALETHIDSGGTRFGIVLMTPDDIGSSKLPPMRRNLELVKMSSWRWGC